MTTTTNETETNYHTLSGLAVGALVFSLLSPLALLTWPLWAFPIGAIAAAVAALYRMRAEAPHLTGRRMAITGLLLGVACFAAAVADAAWYRSCIRSEAERFALLWIDLLRRGDTAAAHQLTLPPAERRPADGTLAAFYLPGTFLAPLRDQWIAIPAVTALTRPNAPQPVMQSFSGPQSQAQGNLYALELRLPPAGSSSKDQKATVPEADGGAALAPLSNADTTAASAAHGERSGTVQSPTIIALHLLRSLLPDGRASWQVISAAIEQPTNTVSR